MVLTDPICNLILHPVRPLPGYVPDWYIDKEIALCVLVGYLPVGQEFCVARLLPMVGKY